MTCIVGLVENNKVYIGGDSAGVAGLSLMKRADEKVFKKDEFIFGFTSSFRMGQLIGGNFQIAKSLLNFHAVGCGDDIAKGCLYGLKFSNKQPIDKIKIALEAAEEFSAGVRSPFNIVELEEE